MNDETFVPEALPTIKRPLRHGGSKDPAIARSGYDVIGANVSLNYSESIIFWKNKLKLIMRLLSLYYVPGAEPSTLHITAVHLRLH